MSCKNCGRELQNSRQQYCEECKRKRQNACVKKCNQTRYKNDPEFRKDMVRRTLEWQSNHPKRHWARTAIMNHKLHGFQITFSIDELENLAFKTLRCEICGIQLDYKKKGTRGWIRNSPSLDNIYHKHSMSIKDVRITCAQCNSARHNMTDDEFFEYCRRIVVSVFFDKYHRNP